VNFVDIKSFVHILHGGFENANRKINYIDQSSIRIGRKGEKEEGT